MSILADPRYQAILAAATTAAQAAAPLNPKVAMVQGALSAILQAAAAFQAGIADGSVTEQDLADNLAKVDVNLAGLRSDIDASKGSA